MIDLPSVSLQLQVTQGINPVNELTFNSPPTFPLRGRIKRSIIWRASSATESEFCPGVFSTTIPYKTFYCLCIFKKIHTFSRLKKIKYIRRFNLGKNVSDNEVKAAFKDGVLNLTIPKQEEVKAEETKIAIEWLLQWALILNFIGAPLKIVIFWFVSWMIRVKKCIFRGAHYINNVS